MRENNVIGKNYKLVSKIGRGSFGEIWRAQHTETKEIVAVKLEKTDNKSLKLYAECKIYMYMQWETKIKDFPKMLYYGIEEGYNVMVLDLLGESLEVLFAYCSKKFSLKTVIMIGYQVLKRIEFIHSKRILHRDIKPDNFAIGRHKTSHRIFIFDFGLSKKYMDPSGEHIAYKENSHLVGTARYASIHTHGGIEQSRRDDLESFVYMMIYFLKGRLPWQQFNGDNKYKLILGKKLELTTRELCAGLDPAFRNILDYVRALKFKQEPDYGYLKGLLKDLFKKHKYRNDFVFDWVLTKKKKMKLMKNKRGARGKDLFGGGGASSTRSQSKNNN